MSIKKRQSAESLTSTVGTLRTPSIIDSQPHSAQPRIVPMHAFFQSQPEATDRCKFAVIAYTSDVYSRDVPQILLHFEFDRETYQKVVWTRFDPANLPKISI